MGGNIFADNIRVNQEQYHDAFNTLKQKFSQTFSLNDNDFLLPRNVSSKSSFGDIDIIVNNKFKKDIIDTIVTMGLPHSKNGNVFSFQYSTTLKVQVDLIFVHESYKDYAYNYLSFGDHGNLIGKMLYPYKCKHSSKGFFYKFIRNDGNHQKCIPLSKDYYYILEILGLDTNQFKYGFDTNEDIFNWLVKSPYFDSSVYSFENLNNKNRTRDRKRKFYNEFIEWLDTTKLIKKPETLLLPHRNFEQFGDLYIKECISYEQVKLKKEVINGNIVSEQTGLTNKDLGMFMSGLKSSFDNKDLSRMTNNQIKTIIEEQMNGY